MTTIPDLVQPRLSQAERCRHVAYLIETYPDHFDMQHIIWVPDQDGSRRSWAGGQELAAVHASGHERAEELAAFQANPLGCGTSCCAAGWAIASTPAGELDDFVNQSGGEGWLTDAANLLGYDEAEAIEFFHDMSMGPAEAARKLRDHADWLEAREVHGW